VATLLVQNAQVLIFRGPGVEVLPAHDILVRDTRIAAIQPTGAVDPSHFDETIRADGRVAMPGMVNTHAHTAMVLWRGLAEDENLNDWFNDHVWVLESNLGEPDVYWGTLLGLAEMIRNGVTTVNDHYWHMHQAGHAVDQAGTRAVLGWAMWSSQGIARVEETARFVQDWRGAANGRIQTALAPHAPYTCDDDFLRATARMAARLGAPIHTHAAETAQQTRDSLARTGRTPIAILEETGILDSPAILAHAVGATPQDIEIMASHDVRISQCQKTYERLAMGNAPLGDFLAAGIPVGVGTDGVMSNSTLDINEVARMLAMAQKNAGGDARRFDVAQTLRFATIDGARVLGLADEIGSLEVGKKADILLIDLDGPHHQPLYNIPAAIAYGLQGADIRDVIVDGRAVMRDRRLMTINLPQVIGEIRTQMERLSHRGAGNGIQSYRS
jgi:5-methylthioadenosine/S-adenosylhomocysteine deaminase